MLNGVVRVQLTNPSNSDVSVADTISLMKQHVLNCSSSPQVLQAVHESGALDDGLTEQQRLERIFSYIRRKVRFVEDEEQIEGMNWEGKTGVSKELLITPPVLLSMPRPQGDCDDFSMLCCSMLTAIGRSCSFVTVAADRAMPRQFTHVYAMAGGIPMDCSHGQHVGWETPNQWRKQVWPVGNGKGIGMLTGFRDTDFLATALRGLGDEGDTGNVDVTLADVQAAATPGDFINWSQMTPNFSSFPNPIPSGGINWNNLLPGIFGSAEKIALQTTQQPGYQTTGPNGQTTSYVLPAGANASNLTLPSIGGSSSSTLLIFGAIGAVVLFAMSRK